MNFGVSNIIRLAADDSSNTNYFELYKLHELEKYPLENERGFAEVCNYT